MLKKNTAFMLTTAILSGCMKVPPGDFCEIAKPDIYASDMVVEFMVENDPEHVRRDISENEYGAANCGWTL